MRKSLVLGIALLLTTGVVLGGTVFRQQVADAASLMNVFVTNDSSHPVPVREQNLDANGNIKVHEQGTAAVHVDNFPATQPVTISLPANAFSLSFEQTSSTNLLGSTTLIINDPAGTRYAITSVTLAATGDTNNAAVILSADPFSATGVPPGCQVGGGQELVTVATPAQGTASASLPQPFVSDATSGNVCLDVSWKGGPFNLSVVGYKTS